MAREVRGNFDSRYLALTLYAGPALFLVELFRVQTLRFIASDNLPARLDAWVSSRLGELSRSSVQRLIAGGHVTVNSKPQRCSYRVQPGDVICVDLQPPEPTDVSAEPIPIDVVFEDEYLLVINKPKGMTVHPAPGSPRGTLVNAVLAYSGSLSEVGGIERPGIVHRLDKDTSGLIVVARSDEVHLNLQAQIQNRTVERRYIAIVWGSPGFEEAVVDAPIGRHPTDRKKMAVIRDTLRYKARKAVTHLRVLERFGGFSLLEAKLETGRTHQVRIHCAFVGHPIVGDPTYGGAGRSIPGDLDKVRQRELAALLAGLHGQALHAFSLAFDHPVTRERLGFEAPPPADFQNLLEWLRCSR